MMEPYFAMASSAANLSAVPLRAYVGKSRLAAGPDSPLRRPQPILSKRHATQRVEQVQHSVPRGVTRAPSMQINQRDYSHEAPLRV